MRVLFIHGRAQGGKDPVKLKEEWVETLREGFAAAGRPWPAYVGFDFSYYGDTLDAIVDGANLPDPSDVVAKGPGQQPDFELFMQEVLGEYVGSHEWLSESAIESELPVDNVGEKGVENWGWVQAIARTIDKHWTGAADFTIERFLKDVHLYVNRRNVARQINQIIFDTLTNEPTVVVGHSLGSVVSYNVIKEKSGTLNAVKHITVGSPLGIKSISSKLGVPKNAAADGWFNAYDPNDIVALNPLDASHFGTTPAIENHGEVVNETSNQHGITGYLDDPKVANAIADALQ